MQQLSRFFTGYVRICMRGNQAERFLNLCAARGITLSRLYETEGSYDMNISIDDYKKLPLICRKTHCRVHILSKHGLPFFFYRNRKRKAFFIGILLFFAVQFFLSGFIWNIHVSGNQKNSTETILTFLEETGVYHGMIKNKVSCAEISADVRAAFPDIIWVSAKIDGTQLILDVKENLETSALEKPKTDSRQDTENESEKPVSIVATKDGIITKMVVRHGIPQVSIGSVCKAGDILISGNIPIVNDSAEIVRYDQVAADADIYMTTKIYYYQEFKREVHVKKMTDEKKKRYFVQLNHHRFYFPFENPYGTWTLSKEYQHQLFLTENFALPISYGTEITESYIKTPFYYDDDTAIRKAEAAISLFCDDLNKKGVQIFENNVKINLSDAMCISKGYLSALEQSVNKVPCEPTTEAPRKEEMIDEQ